MRNHAVPLGYAMPYPRGTLWCIRGAGLCGWEDDKEVHTVKVRFYPHKEFQETLKRMDFEEVEALNEDV